MSDSPEDFSSKLIGLTEVGRIRQSKLKKGPSPFDI